MKTGKAILLGLIALLVIGTSSFADGTEPVQTPSAGERGIVRVYKAIENGVVSGYKAIENSVVSGYLAIENAFVNNILIPRGWSADGIPTGNMTTEDSAVPENSAENSMALSAMIGERYSPVQRTGW